MDAFRAKTTISKGGALHLEYLPFKDGERVEVVVSSASPGELAWPAGYFDATFGAIQDNSFVRHPQGEFRSQDEAPSLLLIAVLVSLVEPSGQ